MHLVRSTAKDNIYFHAMALKTDWPIIVIMTALFGKQGLQGILTICAGISLVVLMHRGLNSARLCLLLCILTMYGATAAYWTLTLQSYSLHVTNTARTVMAANVARSFPATLEEPASDPNLWAISAGSDPAMHWQDLQMCTGTGALLVNITLGDGIVWWRAWVICARKTWVLCLAAILLLSTAAVGITETAAACSNIHMFQVTVGSTTFIYAVVGALFLGNTFGFVSSMVTLLNNIVATGLIGYQAWIHSRTARECRLNRFPVQIDVRTILAFLMESGILYCIVWAFVVAFQAILTTVSFDKQTAIALEKHEAYVWVCMCLIEGALVPLIAIYPTTIIILVTLGNSCLDAVAASACDHGASPASIPRLFIQPTTSESDQTRPLAPVQFNSSSSVPTPIRTFFSVEN